MLKPPPKCFVGEKVTVIGYKSTLYPPRHTLSTHPYQNNNRYMRERISTKSCGNLHSETIWTRPLLVGWLYKTVVERADLDESTDLDSSDHQCN